MFTGLVIDELMAMVARVEGQAQCSQTMTQTECEDVLANSHLAYRATESQAMMIGVA